MARKIKETPVLTGKALERFNSATKANETKTISVEEKRRVLAASKRFKIDSP